MGTKAAEHFDDPRLVRLQNRIADLEKQIAAIPFAEGRRVTVDVATTPTRVEHGLGRVLNGMIVLGTSPDASVGFTVGQEIDKQGCYLEASAAATFTIWFW